MARLRCKIALALALAALLAVNAVQGQTIDWCADAADAATSGTVYEAYYGQETCIPLCVKKSPNTTYNGNLGIDKVTTESPGVYPTGAVFNYPYDEINFPSSGVLKPVTGYADTDPFKRQYCFTPQHGEECVYTTCFKVRRPEMGEPRPFFPKNSETGSLFFPSHLVDHRREPMPTRPPRPLTFAATRSRSTTRPSSSLAQRRPVPPT